MLILNLFEKWSNKYKKSINCANPKGFSQKAHCAGRKKHNESVDHKEPEFIQALRDFLPIAVDHLKLKSLPKIHLQKQVNDVHVASFGGYDDNEQAVTLVINNRQPADILRTLAHELVHWGQGQNNEIDADSWQDGSDLENEANAVAGVIMREFARQHPQHLELHPIVFEAENRCPPATQDIGLNLKNRQKAINEYGYGPLNPLEPNVKFWAKKQQMWQLDSIDDAKKSLCGNCAAFDVSKDAIACIERGIGSDSGTENPHDVVEAGDLGYCRFLKFKCASLRTCDAWVVGGPITEGKHCDAKNAVPELKAALTKRKTELKNADAKVAYDKIDKIMTRIAQTYNISGQKLHDLWTERYGEIPDTWVLDETARTPNRVVTSDGITVKFFDNVKAFYKGHELIWAKEGDYSNPTEHDIHVAKITTSNLASAIGRKKIGMDENFADGKGPGRPGDSQRHGISKGATMAELEKAAKASGRKGQLARWQINMRRGKKK